MPIYRFTGRIKEIEFNGSSWEMEFYSDNRYKDGDDTYDVAKEVNGNTLIILKKFSVPVKNTTLKMIGNYIQTNIREHFEIKFDGSTNTIKSAKVLL